MDLRPKPKVKRVGGGWEVVWDVNLKLFSVLTGVRGRWDVVVVEPDPEVATYGLLTSPKEWGRSP